MTMSLNGTRLHNPMTGLTAHIVDADDPTGSRLVLEYSAPAGSPRRLVDPHIHLGWDERFDVISGRARYRVGKEEADLESGASVTLPAGQVHEHPWNVGEDTLRVRQTSTLHAPDPAAIGDTVRAFAMMFWLIQQGKVDRRGNPNPLQGALILQSLMRHGGYQAGLPPALQRPLIRLLAAVARRRGYVAFDPACLPTPQPD